MAPEEEPDKPGGRAEPPWSASSSSTLAVFFGKVSYLGIFEVTFHADSRCGGFQGNGIIDRRAMKCAASTGLHPDRQEGHQ